MNWRDETMFLLNWLGLPALALLAIVLIYRRWYRVFPFFLVYVIATEMVGLIRLAVSGSPQIYAKVYWISDTLIAASAFLAVYELFFKRLFPTFYRIRFYRLLFPAAAILATMVAVLNALFGGHFSPLGTIIHIYEFLRATVLLFFVMLMLVMGRRWNKQEFGIAAGFGLDVSTSLILLGTWAHTSRRSEVIAGWSVVAYDLACLIWLYCFWSADKGSYPSQLPPDALQEAKKWEGSLKDFIASGKR
jgi:hypothetical protein